MYTELFGLKQSPFNSTTDPRFFFASPQHEEALASLTYAVQQRKGLVVITGDVGSGKTLVSRMMVERLGDEVCVATVNNTHLMNCDLFHCVCREFNIAMDDSYSTMEQLAALEEYLLTQHSKERPSILIIDDAHALTEKHLEQLRLVSNLEVSGLKLLQIILLGQQDLNHLLHKPSSRQLRQRIFRSFHISRFTRPQMEEYIRFRLRAAGASEVDFFEDEALEVVNQYCNGVPRLINNLCDNILLSAYSAGTRTISPALVHMVIEEMMHADDPQGKGESESGDLDQAICEMTQQYVQSLESQIGELEASAADTDQRIQEMHRLSSKLQVQELKFSEYLAVFESKGRELHRLNAKLQEQEHSLNAREKVVERRLEEFTLLSERLDAQDKNLGEREARISQLMRDLERISTRVAEQEQKLDERSAFIEKKLASRQVAFDRELNECKRAVNRKWQETRQMIADFESKETSRTKQLAAIDLRLQRFEHTRETLCKQEYQLASAGGKALQTIKELQSARQELESTGEQLEKLMQDSKALMHQPRELLDRSMRQMEQSERLIQIVQKATDSLQQTVSQSVDSAQRISREASATCRRLEDLEADVTDSVQDLEKRGAKTHRLREVMRQIYEQAESQTKNLRTVVSDAEKIMARLPKQLEELRENSAHPVRLMKEMRALGSAAERNLHDGQLRLGELRVMIDKAEKTRRSIEALMNATRRVTDQRRGAVVPIPDATQPWTEPPLEQSHRPLAQKIEHLAETVRKARSETP